MINRLLELETYQRRVREAALPTHVSALDIVGKNLPKKTQKNVTKKIIDCLTAWSQGDRVNIFKEKDALTHILTAATSEISNDTPNIDLTHPPTVKKISNNIWQMRWNGTTYKIKRIGDNILEAAIADTVIKKKNILPSNNKRVRKARKNHLPNANNPNNNNNNNNNNEEKKDYQGGHKHPMTDGPCGFQSDVSKGVLNIIESKVIQRMNVVNETDYKASMLLVHNSYRKFHEKAKMFSWDSNLEQQAQAWANKRASGECEGHSMLGAENIAQTWQTGNAAMYTKQLKAGIEAVTSWYEEILRYNHIKSKSIYDCLRKDKSWDQQKMQVGHYETLVWKSAKKIGCATVINKDGKAYTVCRYQDVYKKTNRNGKDFDNTPNNVIKPNPKVSLQ